MKQQKTIAMPVGLHYATMVALIIASLCNLWMAAEFSAIYGQAIGSLSYQIENNTRPAVIRTYRNPMMYRLPPGGEYPSATSSEPTEPLTY